MSGPKFKRKHSGLIIPPKEAEKRAKKAAKAVKKAAKDKRG